MTTLLIILTSLTSFLQHIEKNTMKSDIAVLIRENNAQFNSYKGSIVILNDKFLISFLNNEYAYDGKNLYVYNSEDEEITISIPTQEEVININPIVYAKFLTSCSEISERGNNSNTLITSTLLPKILLYDVDKMEVVLKKLSENIYLPVQIDIIKGKRQTLITFGNAEYISEQPQFVIDKPNVYINDIRDE